MVLPRPALTYPAKRCIGEKITSTASSLFSIPDKIPDRRGNVKEMILVTYHVKKKYFLSVKGKLPLISESISF